MKGQIQAGGFSLFELMIAVAVVSLVSAFAVPAYRSYIDTANMTKVTANFEQAVRLSQNTFAHHKTKVAVGLPTNLPSSTNEWIEFFNKDSLEAPGGGPAYIPSNNKKDGGRGDKETGAIGVQWQKKKERLRIWRPLYLSLVEQRADITVETIDVRVLRETDPDDAEQ